MGERSGLRFWGWMILAFLLGTALGTAGLLALMIILQAMISYPG